MNVGPEKGLVLKQHVQKRQPKVAVEVGTYCGYSAILIASNLPAFSHLFCIEKDALNASIARSIIEFAGLSHKVTVIIGTVESRLTQLRSRYNIETIDLLFLDHFKDAYVSDLKLLEAAAMIKKGTVVVADNVIYPGAPKYLEYVRNNPHYESIFYEGHLEYSQTIRDGVEVSVRL